MRSFIRTLFGKVFRPYVGALTGDAIQLIPKWRQINYSFVCVFISSLPHFHFKILLCFIHADEAKRAN